MTKNKMIIEDFVCSAPQTDRLSNLTSCIHEIEIPSPIDFYTIKSREIINFGTQEKLAEMERLGSFLLLGLISTAEGYFRSILSASLDICPISKSVAAEKQINLGGVLWHGKNEFRRSAFEHMSFASGKELMSASKNYLDFEMKKAIFNNIIDDYDTICHIRHGLIHNAGILPGRNAIQIDIPSYSKPVEIRINFGFLQSAAATIDSLVVTFNRTLFVEMCNRWATTWRRRSDWKPDQERKKFLQIWNIFACKNEIQSREDKSRITPKNCMELIRSEYNL